MPLFSPGSLSRIPGSAHPETSIRVREHKKSDVAITFKGDMFEVAGADFLLCLLQNRQTIKLHVFIDRSVLEIYVNDREVVTRVVDTDTSGWDVEIFANHGGIGVVTLDIWEVESIWR